MKQPRPSRPRAPHPLATSLAGGTLGLLLLAASIAAEERVAVQAPDTLSAAVDRIFEEWHRPDSPGAAVLVLRGDEILHARGYGMANLEHGVPIRTGSVFDIASISKQFGAYAIALLEADGLVSVDDDVRDYIPELPDFGPVITLRHLVHHTSGLRDWPGTLSMAGWSYQDVISFEQILRMAYHQRELNFEPGSDYAYSNTGYNVLAEVVARVSGMSFREFTDRRIFRPLGMTKTHFHDDWAEVVPDRADSYRPAPDGGYLWVANQLTALGSSSLFTTVEDLGRWVKHLHDPPPEAVAAVARMYERGVLSNGDTIAYAWGQNVRTHRGLTAVNHGGSWAGYRTHLLRFPEQEFAVILLANTSGMNAAARAEEIAELYLAEELAPPVVAGGTPGGGAGGGGDAEGWEPGAEELAGYAGVYGSAELATEYHLAVREGVLIAFHFRTGERAFRPTAPDTFQASGFGEVRFLRDSSGEIEAFTANQTRIRGLRFDRVR